MLQTMQAWAQQATQIALIKVKNKGYQLPSGLTNRQNYPAQARPYGAQQPRNSNMTNGFPQMPQMPQMPQGMGAGSIPGMPAIPGMPTR